MADRNSLRGQILRDIKTEVRRSQQTAIVQPTVTTYLVALGSAATPTAQTLDMTAVETQIEAAITALIGTAPSTLNTLGELATAINNDPAFASTVATALAGKAASTHNHDTRYYTQTQIGATTDGAAGANLVGATAIAGLSGANVQALLEALKAYADSLVGSSGNVPVGGVIPWYGTVDAVPTGWHLCDGTSGTPDLRGKMILGASDAYVLGSSGGAATVTLSVDEIPAHHHTLDLNGGGGSFYTLNNSGGIPTTGYLDTGSTGGGQEHENLPPYMALNWIMRVA